MNKEIDAKPGGGNEEQPNGSKATRFGRYIREARERRGLSGGQLARALKMHHSYVSRLENDAFRSPSPEKLRKVAEVLELDQGDVFALAGYHRPADLPSFAPYLRAKYR